MALLKATEIGREFKFTSKGQTITLPDPNPAFSPETVLNFYANTYPELNNATVQGGDINNDKIGYEFKSVMGTKG